MHTLPATVASAQFLTLLRQYRPAAPPDPVLEQSIHAWLSYYHALQTVRGGYSPLTVAAMQAQFYPCAPGAAGRGCEDGALLFPAPVDPCRVFPCAADPGVPAPPALRA
jgi:hypothetical protein